MKRPRPRRALRGWLGDGDPPWHAWRSRRLYLTFDDGPDPVWTPRVLDELRGLGVRATFFVVGERAREHLDLVRRTREEGHDVELHCMRHVRHTVQTRAEVERDTDEALELLASAGARPRWWRPPYSLAEAWTHEIAAARGLRLVGGSVDPRDWTGDAVPALLAAAEADLRSGRVITLHDGVDARAPRRDAANTVALIAPLVERIRAKRLHPAPLAAGPAYWWLRTMAPARVEGVEIIDEDELTEADLAGIRRVLVASMSRFGDEYATKGWRRIRPAYRVIARVGDEIAATTSMIPLDNERGLNVLGSGDTAVHPDHRGARLGEAILRAALSEGRARGADAMLGDTTAVARILAAEGFHRVPRFEVFYERDGACHWHPRWWLWEREPIEGRLEIAEGDF